MVPVSPWRVLSFGMKSHHAFDMRLYRVPGMPRVFAAVEHLGDDIDIKSEHCRAGDVLIARGRQS